ncbi:hypothetical protein MYSTI_06506 [Myxococcus stipitatus DSM 14675]|uniref:Uncharacterized protein n=1 Tax=Myxococcus stipitatus (strain DSM 14675 / JCM 12634 / Mx s8) TaxID=1278073 RepID=L7UMT3_MYXSD|nr:hypothetical protein [Myxococcus stipitatus]AGC47779.1 hypothetical protein MYSTI_06506 [Myxococcus stipitatus DSM 14675]
MGWNFGGIIIDHDFTRDVRKAQEPFEVLREAGLAALRAIGVGAVAHDEPIDLDEATKNMFWDHAVAVVHGKTLVMGKFLGMEQEAWVDEFSECSKHGAVLAYHFDDSSGTYMFSLFRDGERVRFRSFGNGLCDDEGELIPGEPMEAGEEWQESGYDTQSNVIEAFLGQNFFSLSFEMKMVHLEVKG